MGEQGASRAIDNIIDNAISFSPPGGLVEMPATHVEDEIQIRIDDEGPGVPEELRSDFNRFHSVRPEAEGLATIRDSAGVARSSRAMMGRSMPRLTVTTHLRAPVSPSF
jgi:hypothetical protein